jgi:DNA (cytosine-5)-methyltransferase 3A
MNVLSLFDGCSGGQVALQRAGFKVDNYFASEIDKYAIKVTQANFPNTIQLGDVTQVKPSERGMGVDYALDYDPPIDLLMGGSPCQGFSFAGHQLNFDDPRSKLFFEFIRIRDECMPKYVLLENVRMAKSSQDIISSWLGFQPQPLNSSKVSAQNRYRLYWFGKRVEREGGKYGYDAVVIPPMTDKGIVMQDILEDGYATDEMTSSGKSHCLTARYNGAVWWNSIERKQRTMVLKDNPTMSKDGLIRVGTADLKGHDSIKRVYAQEGKAPTLTTMQGGHREPKVATSKDMWRKLTPLECERLQTLDDNYTNHVSNSQRYKMIGNGWTVDVIAHILKGIHLDGWNEMYNYYEEMV